MFAPTRWFNAQKVTNSGANKAYIVIVTWRLKHVHLESVTAGIFGWMADQVHAKIVAKQLMRMSLTLRWPKWDWASRRASAGNGSGGSGGEARGTPRRVRINAKMRRMISMSAGSLVEALTMDTYNGRKTLEMGGIALQRTLVISSSVRVCEIRFRIYQVLVINQLKVVRSYVRPMDRPTQQLQSGACLS
jgi:hypothetical protein